MKTTISASNMRAKFRTLLTVAALVVTFTLLGSTAHAQTCQPGISQAFAGPHAPQYIALATTLAPAAPTLTSQLTAVVDQATYQTLLTSANAVAAAVVPAGSGRLVITLPDGTVVIDTARADNVPGDPTSNAFANFQAKTINENHNSRIAIFTAQEYPCGVAVESKLSTSTGLNEDYFAQRAGAHLDSQGTLRLSRRQ